MALDFTPLASAVARLEEGPSRYRSDMSYTQIRDGLIQRFEFTYDLSQKCCAEHWKSLLRIPRKLIGWAFPTLIRTGVEQGLVAGDWPAWRTSREMRHITSHTYDEAKALQVAEAIPGFLKEARDVLRRLQAHAIT